MLMKEQGMCFLTNKYGIAKEKGFSLTSTLFFNISLLINLLVSLIYLISIHSDLILVQ